MDPLERASLQGDTADAPGPAISVDGLNKSFGAQRVLQDVSLKIFSGEFLVVLGPSGSGKTTLLRIIAGLEDADQGEILLGGRPSNSLPPQARNLGVVFQEQALFQRMTAEENIAFGLRVRQAPEKEVCKRVDELLNLVRLQDHRGKYPVQLSGGQRQRVALARALIYRPAAMLLDEPFSSLDAVTRTELRREVRLLLRSMKVPALFITHDQEEALELADRVAVVNLGRIVQMGTPFEVYNHPQSEFVARFLGAANVLLARWRDEKVVLGAVRLNPPADVPHLFERQPVKLVFRPEDIVLNFQRQLLDTPFSLGRGIVEDVAYVGPTERVVIRITPWPTQTGAPTLTLVDDNYGAGFPIVACRSKWEAADMELAIGDPVVVGLKHYRILPHFPLSTESGSKVL